ncbi:MULTISPECIES: TetR/AcrR family transcriptional regulator [Virgibacillus]|uniref:HTH-type transcriptional regulator MtrR n=2 Tax=Virgibacillus TaxID=84406 RepID=A0A024QE67_9BACI|nr:MULTISPECIES: TetR/AcrR family transcriptional regulator [Virgibacillus]EQB35346.1 hypothetical protein M948_19795 [Virgibacillus sp. CM-4]MYL42628.1 TetR family transcriptional regulator [Virgibacillus massiliensis]GGJ75614.1 TetR family transcriptional regulator [Virgibacillus kapii]CDQ40512.1 HTH-type transcriptional regulator MtrR [Virgibacillus massiliensis]
MQTKEKLLLESMELFAAYGYEGTSMAKIAEKVGLKKSSLYAHYTSKETLFLDVTEKITNEYVHLIAQSIDNNEQSSEKRLYQSFMIHVKDLVSDDASIQFYNRFVQYPPQNLEKELFAYLERSEEEALRILVKEIENGQTVGEISKDLEAKQIAHTYFCLLEGLSNEIIFYDYPTLQHHAERIWEVFWRGIRM